jgi:uncharacterized protein (TIGR02246 family)
MVANPADTVRNLIEAINKGELEPALSLYEPGAAFVVQPGKIVHGTDAIRAALEGFISLKPSIKGEVPQLAEAGDIALYCSRWTLIGTSPDGKRVEMNGISSDVLRRQTDGRWLVAIDNPWGTSIVG